MRAARRLVAIIAALGGVVVALGPAVGKPAAPRRPLAPPVVYLAVGADSLVAVGVADLAAGTFTPARGDLPLGVAQELAVDVASGRYALTFHQISGGDPLLVDGVARTTELGPSVILVGTVGSDALTTMPGDPRCVSTKTACFESVVRFEAGGAVLITQSLASRWWMWNRRTVGAAARLRPIIDRKLARAAPPAVSATGDRAAYFAKDQLFVTAWPRQTAAKLAKVKPARKAVASPTMVMSAPTMIGDRVYYFRREPVEQKVGMIAAFDLATGAEELVYTLPEEFPLWDHRVLPDAARGTVLFQHDVQYERAEILEATPGSSAAPRVVARDVRELLDVSADGTFILCSAFAEPDPTKRKDQAQELVVIEVATGTEVARRTVSTPTSAHTTVYDARFAATP